MIIYRSSEITNNSIIISAISKVLHLVSTTFDISEINFESDISTFIILTSRID